MWVVKFLIMLTVVGAAVIFYDTTVSADPDSFGCKTGADYVVFDKDYDGVLQVCPAHNDNLSTRGMDTAGPLYVVIHNTGGPINSTQGNINWFQGQNIIDQGVMTSAHYLVGPDSGGTIRVIQMVKESQVANHAGGVSNRLLNGNTINNTNSIGIEVVGPGGDLDNDGWPSNETYEAVAGLVKDIVQRGKAASRQIELDRDFILGHEEINKGGKFDPGQNWNWKLFMEAHLGGTYTPAMQLTATHNSSTGKVDLKLTARANGRERFRIERRIGANPYTEIQSMTNTASKVNNPDTIDLFSDDPPASAMLTELCYRVWAIKGSNDYVDPSSEACLLSDPNVDVVLIIDSSGSMRGNDPDNKRLDASRAYLTGSFAGDFVGVVDFDHTVRLASSLQRLPEDKDSLIAAINTINSSGGTNIGIGVQEGCDALFGSASENVKKGAILLTNGFGSFAGQDVCFSSRGWPIYTFGLGSGADHPLLREIAENTRGEHTELPASALICEFQRVRSKIAGADPPPCTTIVIGPLETTFFFVKVESGQLKARFSIDFIGSDVVLKLITPSGRVIDRDTVAPDVEHDKGATFEIYAITDPEPGEWQVELFGADVPPEGEEVVFGFSTIPAPAEPEPVMVGGTTSFLFDRSRPSIAGIAALASSVTAAIAILAVGGWNTRRGWLKKGS